MKNVSNGVKPNWPQLNVISEVSSQTTLVGDESDPHRLE